MPEPQDNVSPCDYPYCAAPATLHGLCGVHAELVRAESRVTLEALLGTAHFLAVVDAGERAHAQMIDVYALAATARRAKPTLPRREMRDLLLRCLGADKPAQASAPKSDGKCRVSPRHGRAYVRGICRRCYRQAWSYPESKASQAVLAARLPSRTNGRGRELVTN